MAGKIQTVQYNKIFYVNVHLPLKLCTYNILWCTLYGQSDYNNKLIIYHNVVQLVFTTPTDAVHTVYPVTPYPHTQHNIFQASLSRIFSQSMPLKNGCFLKSLIPSLPNRFLPSHIKLSMQKYTVGIKIKALITNRRIRSFASPDTSKSSSSSGKEKPV